MTYKTGPYWDPIPKHTEEEWLGFLRGAPNQETVNQVYWNAILSRVPRDKLDAILAERSTSPA